MRALAQKICALGMPPGYTAVAVVAFLKSAPMTLLFTVARPRAISALKCSRSVTSLMGWLVCGLMTSATMCSCGMP